MKTATILFLLVLSSRINGQITTFQFDERFISIDFGYTTSTDIAAQLKIDSSERVNNFIYPEFSSNSNNLSDFNAIYFDSLQIMFICEQSTELIQDIIIIKPEELLLFEPTRCKLDMDSYLSLLAEPNLSRLKISTTENSNYWSFEDSSFVYYYHKLADKNNNENLINNNKFLSFEIFLLMYKNTPPDLLLIKHKNIQHYKMELDGNEVRSGKPLYAPLSEMHKNKLIDTSPKFFKFLKSDWVKDGLWIEYYPNHKIKSKGSYKNGKEIGVFYYYNQSGTLVNTVNYQASSKNSIWLVLTAVGVAGIILVVIIRLPRKIGFKPYKNTNFN